MIKRSIILLKQTFFLFPYTGMQYIQHRRSMAYQQMLVVPSTPKGSKKYSQTLHDPRISEVASKLLRITGR